MSRHYRSKTAFLPKCSMRAKLSKRTAEEIEAGRSPKGGFTAAQLASWGVPWPPPKNWQHALINGISLQEAEKMTPSDIKPVGLLTTVFSDASYHDQSRCGGWGAWFKNSNDSGYGGGPFNEWPVSSTQAEVWAIINGVHMALKRAPDTTRVHVVSDCLGAMDALQGKTRNKTLAARETLLRILAGRPITFAHVKSHSGKSDARSYINEQVDKLAKRGSYDMLNLKGNGPELPKKVKGPSNTKSPYANKTEKNRAARKRKKARRINASVGKRLRKEAAKAPSLEA